MKIALGQVEAFEDGEAAAIGTFINWARTQYDLCQKTNEEYGIWITDADGANGRWMSDTAAGKDQWTGSHAEACHAISLRENIYRQVKYEARPCQKPNAS